jgi:Spy/CpxP family protein refolding chaperone
MTPTLIAAAVAFTLLVVSLIRHRRHRGGRYALYFLFKRLKTTPGQEQVIRTALSRVKESGRGIARKTREARPEFASLLRSETFDEASARSWLSERERAFDAFKPELLSSLGEIHSVLDPEQRRALGDAVESGRLGLFGRPHRGQRCRRHAGPSLSSGDS